MTLQKDKSHPIFFHVEFCKPGRNTYLVEHVLKKNAKTEFFEHKAFDTEEEEKKPVDAQLYVHQMITQVRQEEVIDYFNPRHVTRYETDLKHVRHIFKEWKEDTADTMGQIFKHDWDRMLITRVLEDEEQLRRIKTEIVANMHMLKEIYVYLQSKSDLYPWIDEKVIKKFLIDELDLSDTALVTRESLYNIVLEVCKQGDLLRGEGP